MSKAEILAELPKLTHQDRRMIMGYLLELEEDADLLADHDRNADECSLMLDARGGRWQSLNPAKYSKSISAWLPRYAHA